MNSNVNKFKRNLTLIKYNLEHRDNIADGVALMEQCINEKLDNSLCYYYNNLMKNCTYLLSKNPITVLKGIAEIPQEEEENDN